MLFLILFNMFGGLVAGIWLAIKGEWRLILVGAIVSFVMPFVFSIASIPAMGLALLLAGFTTAIAKLRRTAIVVNAIGMLVFAAWDAALICVWVLLVFVGFMTDAGNGLVAPLLIWTYSTTMAPLFYMARSEPTESTGTTLGLMLAFGGYLTLVVLYFVGAETRTMIGSLAVLAILKAVLAAASGAVKTPRRGRDPVTVAAYDAFSSASDAYDEVLAAHHDAIAACTEPADFEPYADDDLDSHSAAIDTLSAAFDDLTNAFSALNPAEDLYASSAALYKAISGTYTYAAADYHRAVLRAQCVAANANLEVAKDHFRLFELELRAASSTEASSVAAKAKAADFKAKAAEDAAKAKLLEQKAEVAETKAEVFLAKAKSGEDRANEAIDTSN